jgi:hypothetical protein
MSFTTKPKRTLEEAVAASLQEAETLKDGIDRSADRIEEAVNALRELLATAPEDLAAKDCFAHARRITDTYAGLKKAFEEVPVCAVRDGQFANPLSYPHWNNLWVGLELAHLPYETRYQGWAKAKKAEAERKDRSSAYLAEEQFEQRLKERLRAGEDLDREEELKRFRAASSG